MDSKPPVQNLGETIHSLLGSKAHLTSAWVKSVCDIVKNLSSPKSSTDIKSKDVETRDSLNNIDVDSETAISEIKDELAALTGHINQLNIRRRQTLNDFLDLKGNIRVFCRIRPIRLGESFGRLRPAVASESSDVILKIDDKKSKNYSFDKVFPPGSSQDEVFSEVEPVIKSVLDGYNACIFAYGQTGTGKTFTMEGTPDSPGIVPRAIEAVFKQAGESNHAFLISFSMLEIYLGNLKDLLVTHPTKAMDPLPQCLSIKTDPKGGIEIDNLVAIQVSDFNQALRLYRLGCRFRSTASTNSNATSSRSHCMIRISITCFDAPERRRQTNKIWLVDLGGSERVLKTKAWGRRLDEGKAINLSLSALGDVINALQRKKRHVPYRNSKLTRVLKDSLGEDSKTLMLVHISPKEEDLCETICSLNFAIRVKSIHLGHEESSEVGDQKEVSMKNLQQKMKHIEEQRLKVRRDIEKLNEKLENLTRPALSFEEHLQASQSSTEEPLSNLKAKNKTGDSVAAPLSQIPRFMRPTASSRRKSGMDPNISDGKDQVHGRRRRPPSHRAESVTFPMKNNSEYNSDHSISRSSCLAGLNLKRSVDNETEYSQETLDYDSKMVVSSQQYTSQRTSIRQKAPLNYLEKTGNQETEKVNTTKFSKVDDWLSHKNEPTIRGYIHSKRVLAIPIPKKKKKREGPSKKEKLHSDEVPAYEFTKENIIGPSTAEKQFDAGRAEMPVLVEINDKPQMMLKELFEQDPTFNSTSPSHESGGQTITEMKDSIGGWSTEEDSSGTLSPLDMCCDRLDQHEEEDEVYIMSIMPEVKGETKCSDSMAKNGECSDMCCGRLDQCEDEDEFYTMSIMPEVKGETQYSDSMAKNGECSDMCCGRLDQHEGEDEVYIVSIMPEVKGETQCSDSMVNKGECSFSESDLVNIVTNQKGDSGVSIPKFELESLRQQAPTEKYIEDNEKEDLDGFFQPSALVTRAGPLKLRSQQALFTENANHNNLITQDVTTEGRTQNEGICCAIKEKFQIVSASALLGLGLHDLGFDHEFFHGLTF